MGGSSRESALAPLVRVATILAIACAFSFGIFSTLHLVETDSATGKVETGLSGYVGNRRPANQQQLVGGMNKRPAALPVPGSSSRGTVQANRGSNDRGGLPMFGGKVDWSEVSCDQMAVRGRKFLVVGFVDEQVSMIPSQQS
jgi:hypothetical protein